MNQPLQQPGIFSVLLQKMVAEAAAETRVSSQSLRKDDDHQKNVAEVLKRRKQLNLEKKISQLKSSMNKKETSSEVSSGMIVGIRRDQIDAVSDTEPSSSSQPNQPTSEIFRSTNAADLHYKKKHAPKKSANKVPSDCDKCGKTFASAFQLKEHVAIQHLNERNFKCEDCSQAFGRRGGLRRHIQMVHQNHLHRCPYEGCDHPGYKCSKALTAHIRSVHTNVRPFVCPDCGKAFVRKNDLKMHQLTHQKDLLYTCECGGNFRRQMYLRKHRKNCELTKRRQQEAGTSESPEELETETTEERKPSSSPE